MVVGVLIKVVKVVVGSTVLNQLKFSNFWFEKKRKLLFSILEIVDLFFLKFILVEVDNFLKL